MGHILCRNCLLKLVIVGKLVRAVRRGRRRKQLLDDRKDRRGYWKLKEEALDRTLWRTRLEEAIDFSSDCVITLLHVGESITWSCFGLSDPPRAVLSQSGCYVSSLGAQSTVTGAFVRYTSRGKELK